MREPDKDMITERYRSEQESAVLVQEPHSENKPVRSQAGKSAARRAKTEKTADKADKEEPQSPVKSEKNEDAPGIKTPSVMKLVNENVGGENQVIAAGKSRIPRQLRGIEPLSKVIRREAEEERQLEDIQNAPLVTKELTEMVIGAAAPQVLARFNACDCEICRTALAERAAAELPSRYIRMPENADLSWDGFTDDERMLIASVRKSAAAIMIRLMIGNKKRNFHTR